MKINKEERGKVKMRKTSLHLPEEKIRKEG